MHLSMHLYRSIIPHSCPHVSSSFGQMAPRIPPALRMKTNVRTHPIARFPITKIAMKSYFLTTFHGYNSFCYLSTIFLLSFYYLLLSFYYLSTIFYYLSTIFYYLLLSFHYLLLSSTIFYYLLLYFHYISTIFYYLSTIFPLSFPTYLSLHIFPYYHF